MLSSKPVDQKARRAPPEESGVPGPRAPGIDGPRHARRRSPSSCVALKGKSASFSAALHTAPLGLLGAAAALQLLALLSRTEAWNVSVRAAGATVGPPCACTARRASGRSRRWPTGSSPSRPASPSCAARARPGARAFPALLGAEVPILATEAILAALTSFTLVGPLGPAVVAAAGVRRGHRRCSGRACARWPGSRRRGLCAGPRRAAQPRRALARRRPRARGRPRPDRAQLPHPALHRRRGVALRLDRGAHRDGHHQPAAPRPERRSGGHRAHPRCARRRHGGGGRRAAHGDRDGGRAVLRRLGGVRTGWGARAGRRGAARVERRGATERAYLRRPPQADLARAIHLPLAFATRPRPWPAPACA